MRLRWFAIARIKEDICATAAAVGAEADMTYANGRLTRDSP
jgi:hypothetical protein